MATALENSYTRVVGSPINASGGGRPGGDNIAISFSKGKKSTQEELDELAIQKAKDDLARMALVPVGSEQQRYEWETENQRLAQEAETRAATQAAVDLQASQLALAQSQATALYDLQSKQLSTKAQQADLALAPGNLAKQRADLALAPGNLAAQQASLAQTNANTASIQQAYNQATLMNPLQVKSETQAYDINASKLKLDQEAAARAAADQAWKFKQADYAYSDAHLGMSRDQVAQSQQFSAARNALSGGPVGSAADDAWMKANYGPSYTTTSDQMAQYGVKYKAPAPKALAPVTYPAPNYASAPSWVRNY